MWKLSLIFASINLFLTSLVLIGVPVLITQRLGFAPNTANRLYGFAQGTIAAGCILGGLLAGVFSKKLKSKTSPFLLMGCAISILLGGAALQVLKGPMEVYIVLLMGCSLMLVLSTLFQIQVMTYLQILTPKELTGKVISCVMCICMCTNPLGQFLYGFVFEKIGSSTYLPFYMAALIMLGISVFTRPMFYGMDQTGLTGINLTDEVDHFNGSDRTVKAFVAGLGASTLNGLLDVFCGQHTKHNRNITAKGYTGNAFGHLVAHIIVVRCAAANDCTKADHRIVFPAFCHFRGNQRNFKGSGNPCDVYAVITDSWRFSPSKAPLSNFPVMNSLKRAATMPILISFDTSFPSNVFIVSSPLKIY